MNIRQRHTIDRIYLLPGDKFAIDVVSDGKINRYEETIGRPLVVNTIVMVDIVNEFGLSDGMGAIFGESDGRL